MTSTITPPMSGNGVPPGSSFVAGGSLGGSASVRFVRKKKMSLHVLGALADPDAPIDRRYEALPRRR